MPNSRAASCLQATGFPLQLQHRDIMTEILIRAKTEMDWLLAQLTLPVKDSSFNVCVCYGPTEPPQEYYGSSHHLNIKRAPESDFYIRKHVVACNTGHCRRLQRQLYVDSLHWLITWEKLSSAKVEFFLPIKLLKLVGVDHLHTVETELFIPY